jgi:hypothetical protein
MWDAVSRVPFAYGTRISRTTKSLGIRTAVVICGIRVP